MKNLSRALVVAFLALCVGQSTFGQTITKNSFETKMYSIEPISHFGLDDQRFAALTEAEKHNLLESRDDLIEMLSAIQMKRDAMQYVTSSMAHKYGTSTALAQSLVEPETSMLAAGISDFSLIDTRTIKLHFFVAAFSEGSIVVSEKSAVLNKAESGWRVARFE